MTFEICDWPVVQQRLVIRETVDGPEQGRSLILIHVSTGEIKEQGK